MTTRPPLLIFDVESIGLHGRGFAVAWLLVRDGEITEEAAHWCHPDHVEGGRTEDRLWVAENVLPHLEARGGPCCLGSVDVREEFWHAWRRASRREEDASPAAVLMADVCWPVETNFLSSCITDDPAQRYWLGPYPLLDAGTLTFVGLRGEFAPTKPHDPLEDARATWLSIRDWWTWRDTA